MKVTKQVVVPFSIGNDKDQPNTKRNHGNNPLEVPIGPITRAKVKKHSMGLHIIYGARWT